MSKILEKQFIAHMLNNPELIDKTSLKSDEFGDIITRCVFSKVKQRHEKKECDVVSKDILPLIFEDNLDLIETQDIQSYKEFYTYIYSNYNPEESFDWMFTENIIKEEARKKKYIEILEKAQENIYSGELDTALNNLDLNLRELDKEMPKEDNIISGNSFLKIYNEETKVIEELKKSNKPTFYSPSHPVLQKYVRMKKGWFCNIIGSSGSGKSLALCQETVEFSKRYNERCLYITDENSDEVVLTYMYCNYLGLKYHDVIDRKIDLDEYISKLPEKELKELKRVFSNIDVIELSGISTNKIRDMLKTAKNNDNPYEFLAIDSFDEMNLDTSVEEITRQNQNAVLCERIPKDFDLILFVTAQLKTDFYSTSIEKMSMMCNHGSKTLIKKSFFSLLLHDEFSKDEDGESKSIGFRGKINKCRSGGLNKIYNIEKNYDYCTLLPSDTEIGVGENNIGF